MSNAQTDQNNELNKEYVSIHYLNYETRVPSTDHSKEYIVTFGKNAYEKVDMRGEPTHAWSCTCPDWIYRKKVQGGDCKHVTSVRRKDNTANGRVLWRGKEDEVGIILDANVVMNITQGNISDGQKAIDVIQSLQSTTKLVVPMIETSGREISVILLKDYIDQTQITTVPKYRGTSLNPSIYAKYFVLMWLLTRLQADDLGDTQTMLAHKMGIALRNELETILDLTKRYTLATSPRIDYSRCANCNQMRTYLPPFSVNIISEADACTNPDCKQSVNSESVILEHSILKKWMRQNLDTYTSSR